MNSQMLPIKLYGKGGPNPTKVAFVLAELGIPYEAVELAFSDVKLPAYLAINPNGRMPAIFDPNTNLTLWESGAIIEYLAEKYDETNRISFPKGSNEDFLTRQWLHYQTSGQGPYYGQLVWFQKYHPEPVSSAIDRYANEIERVTNVLEGWLQKQRQEFPSAAGGAWLVGGKISYADIAFLSWQFSITKFIGQERVGKYMLVADWIARIAARERIQPVFAEMLGG